jgi:WD40 repeat protein
VVCLAAGPDGEVLASGGHDGVVRLWDFTTGRARGELRGHAGGITDLAAGPRGRLLASASSDSTVRVWDAAHGEAVATLAGHGATVRTVAILPGGSLLASGSDDRTVRLWRLAWTTPLALADHNALARVQEVLDRPDLSPQQRRGWRFLRALLAGKFRYDIMLEESVIAVDSFDIEIEIDRP